MKIPDLKWRQWISMPLVILGLAVAGGCVTSTSSGGRGGAAPPSEAPHLGAGESVSRDPALEWNRPPTGLLYQPETDSPSKLLVAPADPLAYFAGRQAARELLAADEYTEAEPLVEQLTRQYPRDGDNWLLLARVKSKLGKPVEAAIAYENAGWLRGWIDFLPGYNAAAQHLAAGDTVAALAILRREIFDHHGFHRWNLYDWSSFAGLRDHPGFLQIVGRPDTDWMTRDEGWRLDLDHLYREITRVNPDYRWKPLPHELTRRYEELRRDIHRLTDEQILGAMSRMIALLRQGHTGVWELTKEGSRIPAKRLPIQFHVFPEGLFILQATEEYGELVGSRVLSIDDTPAEDALRILHQATSVDGEMEYLFRAFYLQEGALLHGLGVAASIDSVKLSVVDAANSTRDVTVATTGVYNWFKLVPPPGAPTPLFLQDVEQAHWELLLPEHDAVYVQFNQVRNDADETLPEFGRRLRGVLAEAGANNLILDVRHNNGGNGNLYVELLRSIIGFSQRPGSRVYVLIGRGTYSAAANFITELDRLADPVFVGEASSECCHLNGDAAWIHMPYSGVEVAVTGARWMLGGPFDARREMSPDVPVQLTAAEYFAGRDPAFEAVTRLIAQASSGVPDGAD